MIDNEPGETGSHGRRLRHMKRYRFDEHTQAIIEKAVVPIGVYQYVDGHIATVAASEGLCRLFGYKDLQEAVEKMDSNMYWNVHPDDVRRVVEIAAGFVREDKPYNLVCRIMIDGGYRFIHTRGQHITAETGERLAVVWYIDEGAVMLDAKIVQDEEKIEELKASIQSLFNNMPALSFSKSVENGRYLACNQAFADYANKKSPEEVVGLTDHEIFDKKAADHFVADDRMALSMDEPYIFYEDVPDALGVPRQFQTTKQRFIDDSGRSCLLGMCVDISKAIAVSPESAQIQEEAQKIERERESLNRLSALSDDYLGVFSVDMMTGYYVAYEIFGYFEKLGAPTRGDDFFNATRMISLKYVHEDDMELVMSVFTRENVMRVIQENGMFTLEYRVMINSVPLYICLKAAKSKSSDQELIVGFVNIDTQKKREEEYVRKLSVAWEKASKDALTGVKNKHSFDEYKEQLQDKIEGENRPEIAVGVFDCNNLKKINDEHGHDKGNIYLITSCRLICSIFRHSPVFRIGGDEFAVVLQGQDYRNRDALLRRFEEKQSEISSSAAHPWETVSVAFGVAVYDPQTDYSVTDLIRRADQLMYENKHVQKARAQTIR